MESITLATLFTEPLTALTRLLEKRLAALAVDRVTPNLHPFKHHQTSDAGARVGLPHHRRRDGVLQLPAQVHLAQDERELVERREHLRHVDHHEGLVLHPTLAVLHVVAGSPSLLQEQSPKLARIDDGGIPSDLLRRLVSTCFAKTWPYTDSWLVLRRLPL